MHNDANTQYRRDADYLYETLEKEVIPLYYQREATGIPHQWLHRMKSAIQSLGWLFNADRMVRDYALHFYLPAGSAVSAEEL
jgi:glucan phosphorylase